ncbi:hypothetical protein [Methylophaga thiooxydans]|uniref:hypothetical protein n=1 Tax=Methylophaga thiooxydans TaxID=392484 RepID=UPI0023555611|nr:hypothetical protein [Methylophaga thiooxydans]
MEPRNYEADASASPPDAPAVPSVGYPTNGDPTSGTPATWPGAHWLYKVGESLRNVITNAGLTPDDGDLSLLQKAIVKLVSATNHVVRLEDVTFGPSVSDGDAVYWDNANSRYDRAIADGTDKQKMVGFADATNSLVEAFGRSALFSGLTAGSKYYLSGSTAGAITTTAPSEKVAVGLAKSATVMFVDIDPIAGTPIQDQSTWNTGTDTTESIISPDKLDAKIKTLAIGEGQTWQDLTASRSGGVTYTNSTGRTIVVLFTGSTGSGNPKFYIDGIQASRLSADGDEQSISAIIPPESTYEADASFPSASGTWLELR